jgi:hypothetical protein
MGKLFEFLGGTLGIIILGLLCVGELYWFWISFQIGSFMMFAVGFLGPVILITAPVGAWSLIFGVPQWVINFFA